MMWLPQKGGAKPQIASSKVALSRIMVGLPLVAFGAAECSYVQAELHMTPPLCVNHYEFFSATRL